MINARADAIKAAKWAAYTPLTRQQLSDKPRRRDPELNPETVTLDVGMFGQFVVIKRPTEIAAQRGDPHRDKQVIRRPLGDKRWCIRHKCRHPLHDFAYNEKRYLHGYSYACKKGIAEMKWARWSYIR